MATSTPSFLAADFSINTPAAYVYPATSYLQPGFIINDNVDGYDSLGTVNMSDRTPSGPTRIVGNNGTTQQVIFDGINAAGNPQYTLLEADPFSGPTPTLTLAAGDAYSYFQLFFLQNTNYAGVWDLDNIRVQPIPEPASLGLLGLAIPARFWRRRQRA